MKDARGQRERGAHANRGREMPMHLPRTGWAKLELGSMHEVGQ